MLKLFSFLFIFLMIFAGSCDVNNSAEEQQTAQTNKLLGEANRQIGLPNVKNFQQKKIMKMIYEETDREDLICYAYIKSDYQGTLVFIGKCIGYGVPFSAQYTNPMKNLRDGSSSGGKSNTVLPQADPNGLYMPTSSSATWLMMIDPDTKKARPVYIEPEIVVSPFKLH
jgi:hypothetical protein